MKYARFQSVWSSASNVPLKTVWCWEATEFGVIGSRMESWWLTRQRRRSSVWFLICTPISIWVSGQSLIIWQTTAIKTATAEGFPSVQCGGFSAIQSIKGGTAEEKPVRLITSWRTSNIFRRMSGSCTGMKKMYRLLWRKNCGTRRIGCWCAGQRNRALRIKAAIRTSTHTVERSSAASTRHPTIEVFIATKVEIKRCGSVRNMWKTARAGVKCQPFTPLK